MIGRRGFLGRMAAAPLAAAAAGQAAGVGVSPPMPPKLTPLDDRDIALEDALNADMDMANAIRRALADKFGREIHGRLPAHIESKKSWSQSYKESVWREEVRKARSLEDALDDAFRNNYDNPIRRAAALAKVAKTVGAL